MHEGGAMGESGEEFGGEIFFVPRHRHQLLHAIRRRINHLRCLNNEERENGGGEKEEEKREKELG